MQLTIPANPNLVTLGQFHDYMNSASGIGKVAAITGKTPKEIGKLTPQAIHEVCSAFETVVNLSEPILPAMFEVRIGKGLFKWLTPRMQLGFIPDMNQMSAAEFADLLMLAEDPVKHSIKIASILFRPIKDSVFKWYTIHEYNSAEIDKHEPFIRQIPLPIYLGARAFFLATHNELLKQIPEFSQALAKEAEKEIKKEERKIRLKQRRQQLTTRWLGTGTTTI
jgi:hypothetical protein